MFIENRLFSLLISVYLSTIHTHRACSSHVRFSRQRLRIRIRMLPRVEKGHLALTIRPLAKRPIARCIRHAHAAVLADLLDGLATVEGAAGAFDGALGRGGAFLDGADGAVVFAFVVADDAVDAAADTRTDWTWQVTK